MIRIRVTAALVAALAAIFSPAAHADVVAPPAGLPCPGDLGGVMTKSSDGANYLVCVVPDCWLANQRLRNDPAAAGEMQICGNGPYWVPVFTPFPPNDSWLSYGPPITLHGQGMRNPDVTSGDWTAAPLDPEAVCRAQEQTVVEAGVLSAAQVFEGEPGKPMAVPMLPQLFYLTLSGHCLWTRD